MNMKKGKIIYKPYLYSMRLSAPDSKPELPPPLILL